MGSLLGVSHLWIIAVSVLALRSVSLVVVVAIALRGTKPADRPAILKAIGDVIRATRSTRAARRSGHR